MRHAPLRLAVRGHGAAHADSGEEVAESQLWAEDPEAIDTIRLAFTVTSVRRGVCGANPSAAHPQRLAFGAFFHAGPPDDDVLAHLIVERRPDDELPPSAIRVSAVLSSETGFFDFADLGTMEVGEWATARLRWDRADRAVVVRVVKTITVPHVEERIISYGPSAAALVAPIKARPAITVAPSSATVGPGRDAIDTVRVNS
jgi:hypothetical protein